MKPIDPRHDPPLSETDIQAYADGFLPPERAAHLRQYLGKRPGEARRVAFYGKLNQQIQDSFVPTDEPLPPPLVSGKALARSAPGRWLERCIRAAMLRPLRNLLALMLAVALALLAASGWMAASQVSEEALNNAAVMALAQATDGHLKRAGWIASWGQRRGQCGSDRHDSARYHGLRPSGGAGSSARPARRSAGRTQSSPSRHAPGELSDAQAGPIGTRR